MANFPENWCFGILPEPRNFPENWCFGTSTQPRPLAESSQHVHRLATCTLQLLKTSRRWIAIDKKSKWIIWGYPDFRTQAIWFSGHSRLNPNFIIDDHYFAALNILSVAHPMWSRLWSLCQQWPQSHGGDLVKFNSDFWQNNSHRNAWFGGTRILGQRDACRKSGRSGRKPRIYSRNWCNIPVVPHKAVAEVSKIGNL